MAVQKRNPVSVSLAKSTARTASTVSTVDNTPAATVPSRQSATRSAPAQMPTMSTPAPARSTKLAPRGFTLRSLAKTVTRVVAPHLGAPGLGASSQVAPGLPRIGEPGSTPLPGAVASLDLPTPTASCTVQSAAASPTLRPGPAEPQAITVTTHLATAPDQASPSHPAPQVVAGLTLGPEGQRIWSQPSVQQIREEFKGRWGKANSSPEDIIGRIFRANGDLDLEAFHQEFSRSSPTAIMRAWHKASWCNTLSPVAGASLSHCMALAQQKVDKRQQATEEPASEVYPATGRLPTGRHAQAVLASILAFARAYQPHGADDEDHLAAGASLRRNHLPPIQIVDASDALLDGANGMVTPNLPRRGERPTIMLSSKMSPGTQALVAWK